MANSWTNESACVAAWHFDTSALTTDSKGTNTLSNNGGSEDTTNKKQGDCAVVLVRSESDYLSIPDANLSSGFPFKSGESTKTQTITVWFRPTATTSVDRVICGKFSLNSKRIWALVHYGTYLRLWLGKTSGTAYDSYQNLYTLAANRWYHASITFDDANGYFYMRLWDDYNSTLTEIRIKRASGLLCQAADFTIGCSLDASDATVNYFDGQIDELVVFNRILAPNEMDLIRGGNFDGTDGIIISQLDSFVEYFKTPKAGVSQVLVEVLYTPPDPNVHLYSGDVPLAITPAGTTDPEWAPVGNVTIGITPSCNSVYQAPGQFVYAGEIGFSVTNSGTLYAQGFRYIATGAVVATMPGATYQFPTKFYTGDITLNFFLESATRLPTPGKDDYSGYGFIDATWLDSPPPYHCCECEFEFTLTEQSAYSLYAECTYVGEGGLAFGGTSIVGFFEPTVFYKEGSGGFKFSGPTVLSVSVPRTISIVPDGGFRLGGKPVINIPSLIIVTPTRSFVGRGGLQLGGDAPLVVSRPKTVAVVAQGGLKMGGPFHFPEAVVTRPLLEEVEIVIEPRGGFALGGDAVVAVVLPPTILLESEVASFKMGGLGGATILRPRTFEHVAEGGFAMGEMDVPEMCDTWALNGFQFEAGMYTNFPFNSYAEMRGQHYAAAQDGIYQLAGEDDDGQRIRPGVRIGPNNYGVANKKRVRSVYCGQSGEETEVRVEAGGQEAFGQEILGRFSISSGPEGKEVTVDVGDFEELTQLEIVPLVVVR